MALSITRDSGPHSQELTDSNSIDRLSRHEDSDFSFEGFPDPQADPEAVLTGPGFSLCSPPSSVGLAPASRGVVLSVSASSGCQLMRSLQLRLNVSGSHLLDDDPVSWDDSCLPDFRWWSDVSHLQAGLPLGSPRLSLFLFTDASDSGWGASLGDDHLSDSWPPDCSSFSVNHRELLAVLFAVRGFLLSLRGQLVALYAHNTTALAYLKKWGGGGHHSQTLNSVAQVILRFCESHRIRLLPQFILGKLNVLADLLSRKSQVLLRMDPVLGGIPPASSPVAIHHRLVRDCSESPSPGLLLTHGGSTVSRHGCDAPVVGRAPGLCLSSFRPDPSCSCQGSAIEGVGANSCSSVLDSTPLISGPSG